MHRRGAGRGRPGGFRTETGVAPGQDQALNARRHRPTTTSPQKVLGSTAPIRPQTGDFSVTSGCGRTSVRIQSDQNQKVQLTLQTEKACKRKPFRKRLMGFEPTTFCMASSCCQRAEALVSALEAGSGRLIPDWALRDLTSFAGSFRTESGLGAALRIAAQANFQATGESTESVVVASSPPHGPRAPP
jgi:hypothetical protein